MIKIKILIYYNPRGMLDRALRKNITKIVKCYIRYLMLSALNLLAWCTNFSHELYAKYISIASEGYFV